MSYILDLPNYQHEKENEVLNLLRENELFNKILNLMDGCYAQLTALGYLPTRNFRVTRKTEPHIYDLFLTAAERLGMEDNIRFIPLYLNFEHPLSAKTVGEDNDCAIIISSECIDKFSDEQLLALFGHELSYIRYGHVKYLNAYMLIDSLIARIPMVGQLSAIGLKTLLIQWRIAAEYTADRGAAIASGSTEPVMKNLIVNMAGPVITESEDFSYKNVVPDNMSEFNLEDSNQFIKLIKQCVCQSMIEKFEQPFGILRIAELEKWSKSEHCRLDFSNVYYNSVSNIGFDVSSLSGRELLSKAHDAFQNKNTKDGLYYLHAAGNKNNPIALSLLGKAYLTGSDTLSKNPLVGISYCRKAALMNDPDGLFFLGFCFENGIVISQNRETAGWLYLLAHEKGQQQAKEAISRYKYTYYPEIIKIVLEELMKYNEGYGDGSCYLNLSNQSEKVNDNTLPDADALRQYLWIPSHEPIYAYEILHMPNGSEEWVALTRYGIYSYAGEGIPQRISWKKFISGKLEYVEEDDCIRMLINKQHLMWFDRGLHPKSVPKITLHLAKRLGK